MSQNILEWARVHHARIEQYRGNPAIVEFAGSLEEYRAAQNSRACFWLDDLQTLHVQGKDAVDLLHRLTMNEIRNLPEGAAVINAFPDANGRIVAAFLMKKSAVGFELIIPNREGEKVASWIDKYTFIEDVQVSPVDDTQYLLLAGPQAADVCGGELPETGFAAVSIAGISLQAARVDGLFPGGILLQVPDAKAGELWRALCEASSTTVVTQPAGLQAYEMLRIEQCVPRMGAEITEKQNPYEAGLKKYISYTKGCFTGQEVIARLDTYDKVKYIYHGLHVDMPEVPQVPAEIFVAGEEVGVMTSVVEAPGGKGVLALGRIRKKFIDAEGAFTLRHEQKEYAVTLRPCPEHEE